MTNREKVIKGLEVVRNAIVDGYIHEPDRAVNAITDALDMLKSEYENGFNDAMIGKQELMYEGVDGKWHKKDW